MDNCLESLSSTEEAKNRIQEVEYINSRAGFEMHEWARDMQLVSTGSMPMYL